MLSTSSSNLKRMREMEMKWILGTKMLNKLRMSISITKFKSLSDV